MQMSKIRAFLAYFSLLSIAFLVVSLQKPVQALGQRLICLPVAPNGIFGKESEYPRISANGHNIAFSSFDSDLVPNDTNGVTDIFVHDCIMHVTTRVSVASDGTQANNLSNPYYFDISDDGRYVAFTSAASNLVSDDTNGFVDAFIRDRTLGITSRISIAFDGKQANGPTYVSDLSANGRFVTLESHANNLVPADNNDTTDMFVHDRITGETTLISVASDGTQGNDGVGTSTISADGRFVAFTSYASNMVPGDNNGSPDVFIHDRVTGETILVSVASNGAQGNAFSSNPSLSADGRYIAFHSDATNLVPGDSNASSDVFVHDRVTKETTLVSMALDNTEGNEGSYGPYISSNGSYVAFVSKASNLVTDDTNGFPDAFVRDLITGETTRISVAFDGTQGNNFSDHSYISPDGRYVVFRSAASNLLPDDKDTNVYVYDRFWDVDFTETLYLLFIPNYE